MTVTAQQTGSLEHGCFPIHFGAPVPQCWFKIAGTTFYNTDWTVYGTTSGRAVFVNSDGLYIWATNYNGHEVLNSYHLRFQANAFLANPTAWEAADNVHRHEVEISSGGLAHGISHAVSSLAHVATDVVDFGLEINGAVLHPLDVNSNGLQLSHEAISLVPDQFQGLVQTATSVLGFGVAAGAAVTAIAGSGVLAGIGEVAGDVAGAVGTTVEVVQDGLGLVSGVVGAAQGVLGAVHAFDPSPSAPAAVAPAQIPVTMMLPPFSPLSLIALAAFVLFTRGKS